MNRIKLNPYPQYNNETCLIILPTKQIYEVGQKYFLIDYFNDTIIAVKYLIHKETVILSGLTDMHTYLAKNCDVSLFLEILKTQYKGNPDGSINVDFDYNSKVDLLTFTNKNNIRDLNRPQPFFSGDVKKSLTSNKSIISSTYKYENHD